MHLTLHHLLDQNASFRHSSHARSGFWRKTLHGSSSNFINAVNIHPQCTWRGWLQICHAIAHEQDPGKINELHLIVRWAMCSQDYVKQISQIHIEGGVEMIATWSTTPRLPEKSLVQMHNSEWNFLWRNAFGLGVSDSPSPHPSHAWHVRQITCVEVAIRTNSASALTCFAYLFITFPSLQSVKIPLCILEKPSAVYMVILLPDT